MMDHIYGNVYIGDEGDARNLEPQIEAVLNVAADLHVAHDQTVVAVGVGLDDRSAVDESTAPCNRTEAYVLAADILEILSCHHRLVLVHCRNGVSRSAAVVALWLVQAHSFSLYAALKLIRSRRAGALRRVQRRWPGAAIPHACHEKALYAILGAR